jgi:putative FmdB family regulatory protein
VCTACGHRFDEQQAFTDAALTDCPECAGRLRKLFGNVGVVFKGPGFYRTDARAASNGKSRTGTRSTPAAAPAASTSSGSGGSSTSSSSGTSGSSSSSSAASPAAASA